MAYLSNDRSRRSRTRSFALQVSDFQVKLCPGAGHGFAHRPMKKDRENAADAMLLATSWLEIYLQKHFAAQPGGVKESEFGFWDLPARSGVPER